MSTIEQDVRRQAQKTRRLVDETWLGLDETETDDLIAERSGPVDAAPSPWPTVNRAMRDEGGGVGFGRGWYVPLAALTGGGKTIAALNLAAHQASQGHVVGYISAEMSRQQTDSRYMAIASGIPVQAFERGRSLDPDAIRRAHALIREVHERTGGRVLRREARMHSVAELDEAMRELVLGHGARSVVVDYIQLFAGDPNDAGEMTRVSHRIREHAVSLNITAIACAQFNRKAAADGVALHHLHGSSAIENDADAVLIVDGSKKTPAPAPAEGWDLTLRLAKNRHGPTVATAVRFDTRNLRLTELLPDELPSREVV